MSFDVTEDAAYELISNRKLCEAQHLYFCRYFFRVRQSIRFIVNWHHQWMGDTVDAIFKGDIENIVFNIPPGGTKTEIFVINFIARGLALNARARFLHLSSSHDLVSLNSQTARDIVTSDEYQSFWPMKIADDASAKKRWNVEIEGRPAGGVYATATGGQVTGFRAGHMAPGFQGAILIDDPLKPEDAFSRPKVEKANRQLLTTINSRKANPQTPIIVIMQRVAENDPSGFILKGNVEGNWKHVRIPAIIDDTYIKEELPEKYREAVELVKRDSPHVDGRFSYWEYKQPIANLIKLERGDGQDETGKRISRHVYSSQYDQRPRMLGGNIIKGANFIRYPWAHPPKMKWRKMYVDTAQKTSERNDRSVFEEWGLGEDGKIYLLDLIKDRWEAPELLKRAVAFWAKAKGRDIMKFGQLRQMPVEDKSSGTGLIQTLKHPPYNIPVHAVERHKDKLTRVMDGLPYIESGQVCIPEDAPFTNDFVSECETFTADDSHDFDDQVDPMLDAIDDMLGSGNVLKIWAALGKKK